MMRSRKSSVLLILSFLLLIAAFCVIYFGVEYETAKIPPHIRARMGDTGSIGFQWVERGMILALLSLLSGLLGLLFWYSEGRR